MQSKICLPDFFLFTFLHFFVILENKAPVYKHLLPVKYIHFILLVCIVKVKINNVVSNPQTVIYSARNPGKKET